MRITEWLTYSDIEQLKQINRFYGWEIRDQHSKYDLIRSLIRKMGGKEHIQKQLNQLSLVEHRFLEQIVLDNESSFTSEELVAKGRAALGGESGDPRSFVVNGVRRGWLFPGYQPHTKHFYHIPSDIRENILHCLVEPYLCEQTVKPPSIIRDEENQMKQDLEHFLDYLKKDQIRLTIDGAIYKQQFRQMMKTFAIPEKPLIRKSPRFGFGRSYHLYPDRFSLIYDYAFYQKYFFEKEDGTLCLTEHGFGNEIKQVQDEGMNMYRFWIRLYKKPIPNLPILVRWVRILTTQAWFPLSKLFVIVKPWLSSYYYHTERTLFDLAIKMMVHLGVIRMGKEGNERWISLTSSGNQWIRGIPGFREKVLDDRFFTR